ncbi:MAG TPA: DNA mismatch repair endonuclease MutL, partial [Ktedonobacterales bacterium]|nr:DNA mismatch repair endonuclease MutL [Ktedonobacterales bacterium]
MPIRQLAPDVAAKIAAGEVVERPASVVKELVENALDAGARVVRVELQNGGLGLIRVTDDGQGIPAEELPLAFARHATSKIGALADLERIATLGFRGEALASIAAVARVALLSRPREVAAGARLDVDEGMMGAVTPAGAAAGTTVTVRDLFASVPARLKFLKTRATETGHALRLVEQYALAYPEVRFSVVSEGRQVFTTPGDGRLFSVLVAVYGLSVAEQLVPLAGSEEGPENPARTRESDGDRPEVSGYVSRPSCYKSTRGYLSFFVNRRWVQSRTLSYAVEEAYHSLLLAGRHPIAIVNVALDPALLDANVHPAKTEVKFLRDRQVYAAVQRAVRAAVIATAETPEVSRSIFSVPSWERPDPLAYRSQEEEAATSSSQDAPAPPPASLFPGEHGDAPVTASGFSVPGQDTEAPVGGTKLPVLRVLGQVSQSYIITEGLDGVYMVDQHAAHERILLERMIAEWRAREVSSQLLLQPVPVELSAAEREVVEEHMEALAAIGFAIEPFGGDALLVRALPAALAGQSQPQPLR